MLSKPSMLLLGIISEGPANAYGIVKMLDAMNVRWWCRVADSTVYATLRSLQKKGLIAGTAERVGNMPEKTVYRLTEKGRQELRRSFEEAIVSFDYDATPFSIAAFFLGVFSPSEQRELVQRRLDHLRDYRTGLDRQVAALQEEDIPPLHVVGLKRMKDLVEAEIRGAERFAEALA